MSESVPSPAPGGPDVEAAAALARRCGLMVMARSLALWTRPTGRRVTPSGALGPAEVPAAARVLGLRVKPPVRRAADVPQVHRGWLMALGAGMVHVTSGCGLPADDPAPAGEGIGDVDASGDADVDEQVLAGWLNGLLLICADASGRRHPQSLQWLVLLALEVMGGSDWPQPRREYADPGYALLAGVRHALHDDDSLRRVVDEQRVDTWLAPSYPRGGDCRLLGLLAEAGLLRGTASQPEHQLTAAGRWLADRLRERAPVRIIPNWPATAVLEHLRTTDADTDPWLLAENWCCTREPVEAARQLLGAAADADAATRTIAVRLVTCIGEQALPAWREVLTSDHLGPHARQTLSWWEEGPGTRDRDRSWLGVEWAATALTGAGPDEALSCLADAVDRTRSDRPGPRQLLAAVPDSAHPQAEQVTAALTEFLASGKPRSIEHQFQVTVRLSRWRPATWRRVLIPATDSLGTLAWTIAVLFGWGFDHLHVFEVGPRRFTDPLYPLEGADDEDDARLSRLFATGIRKIGYTYDLGACWEHEIALERLVPIEPGQPTLRCVGHAGDSPLEYPILEDDDGDPIDDPILTRPFQLDKVNLTLASGHYVVDDDDVVDDDEDEDEDETW
jgi:hypothetical protein